MAQPLAEVFQVLSIVVPFHLGLSPVFLFSKEGLSGRFLSPQIIFSRKKEKPQASVSGHACNPCVLDSQKGSGF